MQFLTSYIKAIQSSKLILFRHRNQGSVINEQGLTLNYNTWEYFARFRQTINEVNKWKMFIKVSNLLNQISLTFFFYNPCNRYCSWMITNEVIDRFTCMHSIMWNFLTVLKRKQTSLPSKRVNFTQWPMFKSATEYIPNMSIYFKFFNYIVHISIILRNQIQILRL